MKKLSIPPNLEEKIYDLKFVDNGISKITSYFPLNTKEKQELLKAIKKNKESSIDFKSIFSNEISNEEWNNSKEQIKKRFQDELVNID